MVVIGGSGVIGRCTMELLGIKDNYSQKIKTLTLEEVAKQDMIFFCLPTPAQGAHDISVIRDYIKKLEELGSKALYIIRSTTTPGQLAHLSSEFAIDRIVHFPEFLTMSTAIEDTFDPDIVVLGGKRKYLNRIYKILKAKYVWDDVKYFLTDLTTSELIKCSINSFYALKVVFANEIYDYANKVEADYNVVKEAMYSRKWIGENHLDVIFNGVRGVRGPCLPKELEVMKNMTKSPLLIAAKEINDKLV